METFKNINDLFSFADDEKPIVNPDRSTIMVIDDNREIIEALSEVLGRRYSLITCFTGDEALTKLSAAVKVVLLDIKMAHRDGIEVFKLLKEKNRNLRIIFNSAYPGDDKKAEEVAQLMHDGYLVKGEYGVGDLIEKIDHAIAG